jgi:hypothetical protein
MFVLNTNIPSALTSLHLPPDVTAWVDRQDEEEARC